MDHALFLDTMIYLHFRPVEDIKWHELLGVSAAERIVIIVPAVTLREIEDHKIDPRLRDRARAESKRLVDWLERGSPEIRPGVRIEGALTLPVVDFAEEDLNPAWNDDVLIAAILDFQRTRAPTPVTLVTDDGVLRLKAGSRGIPVLALPDDHRRPDPVDPIAKENRELKRQLQKYEAGQPKVSLQFAVGPGKRLEIVVPDVVSLSEAEIALTLETLSRKYPPGESYRATRRTPQSHKHRDPFGVTVDLLATVDAARDFEHSLRGPAGEAEIVRYDRERTAFLDKYRKYLSEERAHIHAASRQYKIRIKMVNTGSVPASDVDVRLQFPPSVFVCAVNLARQAPSPPAPPTPPRDFTARLIDDSMAANIAERRPFDIYSPRFPSMEVANVSSLSIKEVEGYVVSCHVGSVKHGLEEALPVIYLMFDGDVIPPAIQVPYKLHVGNMPAPVDGVLNIVFRVVI